jgi:WD40 repeat protein
MSVAFSPNGINLASGGVDFSVKIWDMTSGALVRSLTDYSDAVNWVAFSADGISLATADWSRAIKVWNAADGSLVRSFMESSLVSSVQFSPDGSALGYGRADGAVVLAANSGGSTVARQALDAVAGTEKASYVNKEKAKILVSVTDGAVAIAGATVSTTVTSPKGSKSILTGTTGANGVAVMTFAVNSKQGTGTYRIDATVSKSGYTSAADSCSFTVTR